MDKNRAAALNGAVRETQKRRETNPSDEQIKKLFSKPCKLHWSNGEESSAIIGDVFYTEEAYSRYRAYKESGKPYPVAVEIEPLKDFSTLVFPEEPDGERKLCETISRELTQALKRFVEEAGEKL